ncbi:uncharacterized protein L969DRAFT_18825 [Mixia osmundae IAM 14324]|nr:uncharacterized protein L969DRAFT_18825 [Mixia osmundae IAM 14324]KEI38036.1 hypothetical protein L969DRAFT_18825 [Mixia osmundae IAM 14324]
MQLSDFVYTSPPGRYFIDEDSPSPPASPLQHTSDFKRSDFGISLEDFEPHTTHVEERHRSLERTHFRNPSLSPEGSQSSPSSSQQSQPSTGDEGRASAAHRSEYPYDLASVSSYPLGQGNTQALSGYQSSPATIESLTLTPDQPDCEALSSRPERHFKSEEVEMLGLSITSDSPVLAPGSKNGQKRKVKDESPPFFFDAPSPSDPSALNSLNPSAGQTPGIADYELSTSFWTSPRGIPSPAQPQARTSSRAWGDSYTGSPQSSSSHPAASPASALARAQQVDVSLTSPGAYASAMRTPSSLRAVTDETDMLNLTSPNPPVLSLGNYTSPSSSASQYSLSPITTLSEASRPLLKQETSFKSFTSSDSARERDPSPTYSHRSYPPTLPIEQGRKYIKVPVTGSGSLHAMRAPPVSTEQVLPEGLASLDAAHTSRPVSPASFTHRSVRSSRQATVAAAQHSNPGSANSTAFNTAANSPISGSNSNGDDLDPYTPSHYISSEVSSLVLYPNALSLPQLLIIGLPEEGAKSRVETQLKLALSLVRAKSSARFANDLSLAPQTYFDQFQWRTPEGHLRTDTDRDLERISQWKWIKLPAYAAVKRKNRKADTIDRLPEETLFLDCCVLKSTEPHEDVTVCEGCQARETKRAQRRGDTRRKMATEQDSRLEPDEVAAEAQKILVFNCNEYLDFEGGETNLPARITCYCRHHGEKVGFSLVFTLRDHFGSIVASSHSPPIMLTDDHKAKNVAPARKPAKSARASQKSQRGTGSSRGSSRKNSATESSGADEPQAPSAEATTPTSPKRVHAKPYDADSRPKKRLPSSSFAMTPLNVSRGHSPTHSRHYSLPNLRQSSQSAPATPSGLPGTLENLLSINNSTQSQAPSFFFGNLDAANRSPNNAPFSLQSPLTSSATGLGLTVPRDRAQSLSTQAEAEELTRQLASMRAPARASDAMDLGDSSEAATPTISRIIPHEGSIQGGIEVTILGQNFAPGMELFFGDMPAAPVQVWSSSTIICTLPPSPCAGPVLVSFRGAPATTGREVKFFNYLDVTDRNLMELALQVVGLKMTGRIEEARNVALRIVGNTSAGQGPNADASMSSGTQALDVVSLVNTLSLMTTTFHGSAGSRSVSRKSSAVSLSAPVVAKTARDFQSIVIEFLSLLDLSAEEFPSADSANFNPLSLADSERHTLLHLATVMGFDRLAGWLLEHGIDFDAPDRGGFTALHFASISGRLAIARLLVGAGSATYLRASAGHTSADLARMLHQQDVLELLTARSAPSTRSLRRAASLGEPDAASDHASSDGRYDDDDNESDGSSYRGSDAAFEASESDIESRLSRNASFTSLEYVQTKRVRRPQSSLALATTAWVSKQATLSRDADSVPLYPLNHASLPPASSKQLSSTVLQAKLARRLGYTPEHLSEGIVESYRYHSSKYQSLKQDRMLYLWWLPVLLIGLSYAIFQGFDLILRPALTNFLPKYAFATRLY